MARDSVAKLVGLQQNRIDQIQKIGNRMRARLADARNRSIVELRITAVNQRWEEINKTNEELATRADAAGHAYLVEDRFEEMARIYDETIDFLLNAVSDLPNEGEAVDPRRRRRDDDDDESDEHSAKLPRLDLPTFSGKSEDWDSFADQFAALVGNSRRVNNVSKLKHLMSCLKGPAAILVKEVPILGINYESTLKTLRDRYYNPRLTVNRHLDTFYKLPFLKKESATELRAFVDETQRIIRALTNLEAPVANWDMWLVHWIEVRLDSDMRKVWELDVIAKQRQGTQGNDNASRFPKFVDLMCFLESRAQSLSIVYADKEDKKFDKATQPTNPQTSVRRVHHAQSSQPPRVDHCAYCSEDHKISRCPTFSAIEKVGDRKAFARGKRLCYNCLGRHNQSKCQSKYKCKHCGASDHHTLLHPDAADVQGSAAPKKGKKTPPTPSVRALTAQTTGTSRLSVNACGANTATSESSILLATAQVLAFGSHGKQTRVRALFDQGSEATFVSESLVQLLDLYTDRVQTELTGVGGCIAGVVQKATTLTIQSHIDPSFNLEINAFVLPQLTSQLPSRDLVEIDLELFKTIPLADPQFHLSDRVDVMLGCDVYGQLLRSGVVAIPTTSLVAQNTIFGWIISGPTKSTASRRAAPRKPTTVKALRCAVTDDLSDLIQRFWTVEEVPVAASKLKPTDEACENLFAETHTRGPDGRFTVRLPLISELPRVAAETRRLALGSLKHQHRRFLHDSKLARSYTDFMDAYLKLGHMELVPPTEVNDPQAWYVPHHPVVSGDPDNFKVRIVFDASRRTREKHCLNDFLMAGPPLQSDLSLILLNWRRHRYVFTADIVKMFRQIRLAPEDQDRNRIVWSPSPAIPVADYRLTTVTYGTTCAPYLAIRTLLQLASDERSRFPLGAACLESDTYVDDTFAGADELATAVRKREELVGILKSAGIELDKWVANHSDLLAQSIKR